MTHRLLTAFTAALLLAGPVLAASPRVEHEPPSSPYKKVSTLVALPSFLRRSAARDTAAALIALLDEERTLKRLVEHHHEREKTALFTEVFEAHAARPLA